MYQPVLSEGLYLGAGGVARLVRPVRLAGGAPWRAQIHLTPDFQWLDHIHRG